MKKIILVLILSCLLYNLNAQEKIEYYKNGQLLETGRYFAKTKIGIWIFYYKNGQVKQKGRYYNNFKVDEWKTYYEFGALKSVGSYFGSRQAGTWKYYNENGKLNKTVIYGNSGSNYNINIGNMRVPNIDYINFGSAYNNGSIKTPLTQVRLNFESTAAIIFISSSGPLQYGIIHPPNSEKAFFLKDNNGKTYKLKAINGWNGDAEGGYGRRAINEELSVVLSFENIPLDSIKSLDLIEGNCTIGCWSFYNINFIK